MAYSSSVTVQKLAPDPVSSSRSEVYLVTITETEAAQTSEVTIAMSDPAGDGSQPALPSSGRILSRTCILTAGTGTTIDPILGDASNPASAAAWKFENDTAAASVHEVPVRSIPYYDGTLYHRSVPNDATADHSITTKYIFAAGIKDLDR